MASRPVQAAFGALCFAALGCSAEPAANENAAPKRRAPTYGLAEPILDLSPPTPRDDDFRRGLSLALSGGTEDDDLRKPAYARLLDEMVGLGASDLELVVEWSQMDERAIEITPHPLRTVDDDLLRWLMDEAKDRKLRVFLSPVLDIEQTPHVGVSPAPGDWDRWWWSYNRFIQHYARIADGHGAALLSIGHDLQTTESEAARWRELVTDVRKVFEGPLTYVSRAARVDAVAFWDVVDVLAVSTRASLDAAATDAQLEQRERAVFQKVATAARKLGRGYLLSDGAEAVRRERLASGEGDAEKLLELRTSRALYRALSGDTQLTGLFSAGWLSPGRVQSVAGVPRATASAQVLARWFTASRKQAAQGRSEPTSQVAR